MVRVLQEGSNRRRSGMNEPFDTANALQDFTDLCCSAYNSLRKKAYSILSMLELSLNANVPGITQECLKYVHNALRPLDSDVQSEVFFSSLIRKSVSSKSAQVNFFVHGLAHARASSNNKRNEIGESTLRNREGLHNENPMDVRLRNVRQDTSRQEIREILAIIVEEPVKKGKNVVFPLNVWHSSSRIPYRIYRTIADIVELVDNLGPLIAQKKGWAKFLLKHSRCFSTRSDSVQAQTQLQSLIDQILQLDPLQSSVCIISKFFTSLHLDETYMLEDGLDVARPIESQRLWSTYNDIGLNLTIEQQELGAFQSEESEIFWEKMCSKMNPSITLQLHLNFPQSQLEILVKHARALSIPNSMDLPNAYIKLRLNSDNQRGTFKCKTNVVKRNNNPSFNEMFIFSISPRNRLCSHLEVSAHSGKSNLGSTHIDLSTLPCGEAVTMSYDLSRTPKVSDLDISITS